MNKTVAQESQLRAFGSCLGRYVGDALVSFLGDDVLEMLPEDKHSLDWYLSWLVILYDTYKTNTSMSALRFGTAAL